MTLSGTERSKWIRLKSEIIKRPFLAYRIGLTAEEIADYFSDGFPTSTRLHEIDQLLVVERFRKIERLRPALTHFIGYRGSAHFAEKIGTGSMTIKYMIDGKTEKPPSHDLLAKIEVYLSHAADFEVSIENLSDKQSFLPDKVSELKTQLAAITASLTLVNPYFDRLKTWDKKNKKSTDQEIEDDWQINRLRSAIGSAVRDLISIQSEIEMITKDFLA